MRGDAIKIYYYKRRKNLIVKNVILNIVLNISQEEKKNQPIFIYMYIQKIIPWEKQTNI